jgi:hypothetical protein
MTTFFAIVGFLVFQVGLCTLSIYLSGTKRHRKLINRGLFHNL